MSDRILLAIELVLLVAIVAGVCWLAWAALQPAVW